MLTRAYSVLDIKSVNEETRTIEGIATTPSTDRMDDIVDPMGATFTLPLPFLRHHKSDQPVGHVTHASPTPDGIQVRVQFVKADEPPVLKERLDLAWAEVKTKLVRGLSIGFSPIEVADIKGTFGRRFLKWAWLELSAVTIPANQDATITMIRSVDTRDRAASGTGPAGVARPSAGVSAPVVKASKGASPMKTTIEQISAFEATRAAKAARRSEIMQKSGEDGVTLDAAQTEEYDTIDAEIKGIDAHLVRLHALETEQKAAAVPADGSTREAAAAARGGASVITLRQTLPPGIEFARYVICRMASYLSRGEMTATEVAKQRYPDNPRIQLLLKAAVASGTTLDSTNAGPLAYAQDLPGEFIDYLRPMTIIGRIPSLRRVPFNVRMVGQTSGGTANWVGQGKPKPLTAFAFEQVTLGIAKIAAISVIADELARYSSPSAEAIVRDSLASAVVAKQDSDFIDPAIAAVSNVSPASITNGLTALSSAGTSADNARTDLGKLLKTFLDDNLNPTTAVIIMPNSLCLALSLMVNALGQPEFPGLTMAGGTLMGIPVIGSQYAAITSQAGNIVVMLNASDVLLADDGQVTIDVSREASLEMLDGSLVQNGAAGTGADLVSLWQNNLLGIRAERYINWKKRRAEAVVYMDDVNWGSIGSPA